MKGDAGMTKERFVSLSDMIWRILLPIFLAVISFVLQSAATELKELRGEIKTLRYEIQSITVELASLKTRLDYHERAAQ
jgi:uncharacterized protein YoxC